MPFLYCPINFSIALPRDTWERLVRLRHQREIYLEGQLAGLLDEAIMGRYDLGLSKEEATKSREYIANNYMNPYEEAVISENMKEEGVISENMKVLIKTLLGEEIESVIIKRSTLPSDVTLIKINKYYFKWTY